MNHAHDWDWLIGEWSVKHRRLRDRLAGCTDWDEFGGMCRSWETNWHMEFTRMT